MRHAIDPDSAITTPFSATTPSSLSEVSLDQRSSYSIGAAEVRCKRESLRPGETFIHTHTHMRVYMLADIGARRRAEGRVIRP